MDWKSCKNILCIRPDNMGDVIMTIPALRALKQSFGTRITLLTSSMAKGITGSIPEIDDCIIFDLPWVKIDKEADTESIYKVIDQIKAGSFDAAVVFTVYSQNPLPAAMLAYMAGISLVLAYSRENPYHLLSNWVTDKEPYSLIKHQVRRDLDLVATVGAKTTDEYLKLTVNEACWQPVLQRLTDSGINVSKPWLIFHPGVSEKKRQYPAKHWVNAAKEMISKGYQVLLTGVATESDLTNQLQNLIGAGSFSAAGLFNIEEFICLIKHAPVLVSVNTGTVHIAAAVGTPVVVLYAQTNPQHTPWNVPNVVLPFPVPAHLRSNNEVIRYVNKTLYSTPMGLPLAADIRNAVEELLNPQGSSFLPSPGKLNENREIAAS